MIVIEQIKAFWKGILSYTEQTWDIEDYPLRYRKQSDTAGQYEIGELKLWIVQVINWWAMTGVGDTKQEAFEQLKSNFRSYLVHNDAPRPGTKVPLQYADTSQIDKLEEIACDFFNKILNMNYYDCFISDQSLLFDFGRDESEALNKINAVYNLRLTDIGDGNIVRLLKMIRDNKLTGMISN